MRAFIIICVLILSVNIKGFCQEKKPTETQILFTIVIQENGAPFAGKELFFKDSRLKNEFKEVTNSEGKLDVLLPKGHQFTLSYQEAGRKEEMTTIDVPEQKGMLHMQMTLQATTSSPPVNVDGMQPTESEVLLNVHVSDMEDKPRPNQVVVLKPEGADREYKGITNEKGTFQILIPKGLKCDVFYKSFISSKNYAKLDIPDEPGLIEQSFTLKYDRISMNGDDNTFLLDVHFHTDKSTLIENSFKYLDDLVEQLKLNPTYKIEVAGHTDSDASDEYNLKLSQSRADVVKKYLTDHGIADNRIQAKGYGESTPIASNDTSEGKAKNRRTEVRIISK